MFDEIEHLRKCSFAREERLIALFKILHPSELHIADVDPPLEGRQGLIAFPNRAFVTASPAITGSEISARYSGSTSLSERSSFS